MATLPAMLSIVSIHAPGRGATTAWIASTSFVLLFQFTHPGGVRQVHTALGLSGLPCFNSRTREGCDGTCRAHCGVPRVSIHAPGRGATKRSTASSRPLGCFNSRTREGCDHRVLYDGGPESQVSIHAPGRGATLSRSTPIMLATFQFTHPGGVRLLRGRAPAVLGDVSIHAPGRGATVQRVIILGVDLVSIHAPGRGATIAYGKTKLPRVVSIHAPGRGATYYA